MDQTRREFIGSVSAVGLAAVMPATPAGPIAIAPEVASTAASAVIPWHLFRADGPPVWRCCLETPFVKGGYMYATDARILIRQPTHRHDTRPPAGDRKFPNAGALPWPTDAIGWEPWPARCEAEYAESDFDTRFDCECPRCYGEKRVGFIRECSVCKGEGLNLAFIPDRDDELSREFGHFKKCEACDGHGAFYRSECPYCDAGRRKKLVCWQPIGVAIINGWFDLLIRNLPGPVTYLPPLAADDAIYFSCGDRGEGCVMPMLPRESVRDRVFRDYENQQRKDSKCLC